MNVEANDGNALVVYAGETPISEQIPEAGLENLMSVKLIGKPTKADMVYLRDRIAGYLSVLDLKDAVIDTLCENDLDLSVNNLRGYGNSNHLEVYLPVRLKYVERNSLVGGSTGEGKLRNLFAFITGYSPVFSSNEVGCFVSVAEGNEYCVQFEDGFESRFTASANRDTIFYIRLYEYGWGRIEIPEGVATFAEGLLKDMLLTDGTIINLPSTLVSIGKNALADFLVERPTCICPYYEYMVYFTCAAVQPPTMNELALGGSGSHYALFVPDENVEAYRQAEGWSKFAAIRGISEFDRCIIDPYDDIQLLPADEKAKTETRPVRLKENNAGGFDLEVRDKKGVWKTVLP